ncbi:hypothetical protein ACXR2T_10570 [Leucobacter sp. HY1910]
MSYLTQSRMAQDYGLIMRIAACAASHGVHSPTSWADQHRQRIVATTGWDTAYTACTEDDPGECEEAITDGMIDTAVQAILTEQTPDVPEEVPE